MKIEEKSIAAIRSLSIDMIEKAGSGHPGMPLGAAPAAYALYRNVLKANPQNPNFFDRDRVIFSAGHCSALIYSVLHCAGYNLSMDEIKNFRQINSKTPGHPEVGVTEGVDCGSGPLGQGFATAVGFALAEKMLANRYNKDDIELISHNTYVFMGEGCLMEGISYEAASLAGKWKLNKLIAIYDCNKVSIDGSTDISFVEDIEARFKSQLWNVIKVDEINDYEGVTKAINEAKQSSEKPTLIIVKSIIGFGSELQGLNKVHGSPLKGEQVINTKKAFNYDYPPFTVPQEVYDDFACLKERGAKAEEEYNAKLKKYSELYREEYEEFISRSGELVIPGDFDFSACNDMAGRDVGAKVLNFFAEKNAAIVGGTADLASSTKAVIAGGGNFVDDGKGRNLHFGIREFAMAAITNGLSLHGGFIPFCSTFFVFSDYMRNAIRMAALMETRALYLLSHDGIEVGEDGPTHQPIEQLVSLRAMPNVDMFRPGNSREVYAAYLHALKSNHPTVIALAKSKFSNVECEVKDCLKGAYVLSKAENSIGTIIATGTETIIALAAQEELKAMGINVNVVSAPCLDLFDRQSEEYKQSVISKNEKNILAVEAGATLGWYKYLNGTGRVLGVDEYGASAKSKDVYAKFGLTKENVVKTFIEMVEANK